MNAAFDKLHEENIELFPIRTVSAITGVNAITLRAWERRYSLIQPKRTDTGHRLYDREDIEKINKAVAMIDKGISISQVAMTLNSAVPAQGIETSSWSAYREKMVEAISGFNEHALEDIYQEALSLHPIQTVTRMLIVPLCQILGERWQDDESAVAEEHFFSVFLRNKLGARFHHRSRHNSGPKLLLACLPNEYHEGGLLLFGLAADEHGYQQVMLGANMPLQALENASSRSQADAIVLSGRAEPDYSVLSQALPRLIRSVSIPVFIGGRSSVLCHKEMNEAGAIVLGDDISRGLRLVENSLKKWKDTKGE